MKFSDETDFSLLKQFQKSRNICLDVWNLFWKKKPYNSPNKDKRNSGRISENLPVVDAKLAQDKQNLSGHMEKKDVCLSLTFSQ